MPSANKDRFTISLHLDKRICALLKRCSAIEKIPMSRIVDQQLSPYLEKYSYDTKEESEIGESIRLMELARQKEIERLTSEPSRDSELSVLANTLSSLANEADAPKKAIKEMREYLMSKLDSTEIEKIKLIQKEQKAENERWKEIVKKYPLT